MTSETVVRVEQVGKKFCRSLKRSLWYGLRDLGSELVGRQSGRDRLRRDEFWALRDVSFDLRRGETLGLIGHNGAGKTTLLKMLSGLIKPDAGRIEVTGRVQALIALGAGFNPVLTGRENVYINASILGLRKREIDRLFPAIVEFAGVGEFIDMPVQSYSSGMAVRLGFAVAAHLDPDILLVDEVLSVGDLAFRTRCQVRIQELKEKGVSIVFVSHNLHTVSHVCTRAITFDHGRMLFDGATDTAIDKYRETLAGQGRGVANSPRGGTGEIRICRMEVLGVSGEPVAEVGTSDFLTLRLHYRATQPVDDAVFNVGVFLDGHQITGLRTDVDGVSISGLLPEGYVDLQIPQLNLLPNIYTFDVAIFHRDGYAFYDRVNDAATVRVRGGRSVNGAVYLPHTWVASRDTAGTLTCTGSGI